MALTLTFFLRPFDGQAASETEDAGFGSGVGGDFKETDVRVQRCDVDDAAVPAFDERFIEALAGAQECR